MEEPKARLLPFVFEEIDESGGSGCNDDAADVDVGTNATDADTGATAPALVASGPVFGLEKLLDGTEENDPGEGALISACGIYDPGAVILDDPWCAGDELGDMLVS